MKVITLKLNQIKLVSKLASLKLENITIECSKFLFYVPSKFLIQKKSQISYFLYVFNSVKFISYMLVVFSFFLY